MSDSTSAAPVAIPAAVLTYSNDTLLTIDTHPQHSLLASGTIHGEINFYGFKSVANGSVSCQCVDTLCKGEIQHDHSCRSLRFSKSGKYLYGGHKNKRLVAIDVETRKQVSEMLKAHEYPINKLHPVSERLLATGDEEGCIKVWDSRTRKEVISTKENLDFISDMASKDSYLLTTSGDGSLTVLDLRQKKLDGKSDISESELLSVALVKGGTRVVTGNGEGTLGIFMWNVWGDIIERFPVMPSTESVDSLIQISDSVLCAGGMDGKIRAVQILPNKLMGVIGNHSCDYSVDELCLTHDNEYLVSSSFDCIKFWSTQRIPSVWVECSQEDEPGCEAKQSNRHRKKKKRKHRKELDKQDTPITAKKKPKHEINKDFFSDL